jgi:hypothetical protein
MTPEQLELLHERANSCDPAYSPTIQTICCVLLELVERQPTEWPIGITVAAPRCFPHWDDYRDGGSDPLRSEEPKIEEEHRDTGMFGCVGSVCHIGSLNRVGCIAGECGLEVLNRRGIAAPLPKDDFAASNPNWKAEFTIQRDERHNAHAAEFGCGEGEAQNADTRSRDVRVRDQLQAILVDQGYHLGSHDVVRLILDKLCTKAISGGWSEAYCWLDDVRNGKL